MEDDLLAARLRDKYAGLNKVRTCLYEQLPASRSAAFTSV